jgi:transposase
MSKRFLPWDIDQVSLFPPSVSDYVPASHPAHFVRDLVRDELDLEAVYASYDDARGAPAFHPAMMTALLLYAYTQGLYSSRRIARACEDRLDFHAVTASAKPDFRTISEFRKRHLKALSGLFVQVLKLCAEAGLVKLGHVALDGTKIKANASRHKAMSYARMQKAEVALAAEVAGWLKAAEAADRKDVRAWAPASAATSCPTGLPTNSSAWRGSARPRPRSKPRPGQRKMARRRAMMTMGLS